jgi:DNA-binding IclR family transcriptional regulator
LTDQTPITRDALLDELRATRERGYAVSDEDVTRGIAAFGAPIFDHTGAVRASLSVGGIREHLYQHRERAIELLRSATAEISRTLGYDASLAA